MCGHCGSFLGGGGAGYWVGDLVGGLDPRGSVIPGPPTTPCLGLGYGGGFPLRPRSPFFPGPPAPICAYLSSLAPVFPVFGASVSHCPPCAALFAEFFSGGPLGRGPPPGPRTERPPMTDAYGHTTGNTPERLISEVNPSQAQLVLRWETTWEHWVLYAFHIFAFFRHLPRRTPTRPLRPDSSPPSNVHTWHMCHCVRPGPRRPPSTPTRRLRHFERILVHG